MKIRCGYITCILTLLLICFAVSSGYAAELELAGIKLTRTAMAVLQKYGEPDEVRVGGRIMGGAAQVGGGPSPVIPSGGDDEEDKADRDARMSQPQPRAAAPVAGATRPSRYGPEFTWVYKLTDGRTVEFIISGDGYVIQIAAFGAKWPGLRTTKGITMGSSYKDLITKYGFPETQSVSGANMQIGYPTKHRVLFSLIAMRVVGITIALVD